MYEGRQAQIYISDPELIRLIFIKDFDHFHNKRIVDFGHPLINEMMDVLPYDKWKVVRSYFSPQLTTGKIRAMSYQMMDSIDDWMTSIKKKADGKPFTFSAKETFNCLTVDVIARCAFGTKINALEDPKGEFMKFVKDFSFETTEPGLLFSLVQVYPFLIKLAPFIGPEVMDYFGNLLETILTSRRKSRGARVGDFVDVMNDMIEKCETDEEYKKIGITATTAMCQAMIFLLAGFETTAATLSTLSHLLSLHPEVQDRLIEEVDAFYAKHGKMNHEHLNELGYLQACMNETLRIYPPLIRLERVCQKDWYHEPTGLKIKKDMVVQVPVFSVHYDENHFPNATEFNPDRFLPENKDSINPYTFLSFGIGNHNCIGMRFAKEEVQMSMASILKEYRFEPVKETKLVMKPGRFFLTTFEPFDVKIVPRKTSRFTSG